jgi:hypothetical protein
MACSGDTWRQLADHDAQFQFPIGLFDLPRQDHRIIRPDHGGRQLDEAEGVDVFAFSSITRSAWARSSSGDLPSMSAVRIDGSPIIRPITCLR